MKKFQFSLQRIHNYKDQILNREKNELALLHRRRNELLQAIKDLENFIFLTNAEKIEKQKTGLTIFEMSTYSFTIDNARTQIQQIYIEIAELDVEIAKQTQVVMLASQEVKGLDKLYENQREDYNKAVMQDEENTIAELISIARFKEKSAV
ncbi:MAG: flagellar FliJ family protein [Clostridia bacterium]